jgi:hypothetical protein
VSEPSESSSLSSRAQIIVAVIGVAGLVAVAIVTGLFGLLSGGADGSGTETQVTANGGSSKANGTCIGGGVVVQGSTVNCSSTGPTASGGLRVSLTQTALQLYDVAFARDIGVPPDGTAWQTLHDEGGTDVYNSTTRMMLTNRSSKPMSITDIHVEIVGTETPARVSEASVYTQGDMPLKQFAVPIKGDQAGATAPFYHVNENGTPTYQTEPPDPPFFQDHTISLGPGEIYNAGITVQTLVDDAQTIDYRFVIKGSTADQPFQRTTKVQQVSSFTGGGDGPRYEHTYILGYLKWAKGMGWCPDVPLHEWSASPVGTARCP